MYMYVCIYSFMYLYLMKCHTTSNLCKLFDIVRSWRNQSSESKLAIFQYFFCHFYCCCTHCCCLFKWTVIVIHCVDYLLWTLNWPYEMAWCKHTYTYTQTNRYIDADIYTFNWMPQHLCAFKVDFCCCRSRREASNNALRPVQCRGAACRLPLPAPFKLMAIKL